MYCAGEKVGTVRGEKVVLTPSNLIVIHVSVLKFCYLTIAFAATTNFQNKYVNN